MMAGTAAKARRAECDILTAVGAHTCKERAMAHAEKSILIHRPVESVFDFVLNGANNKLWRSSVLDIKPLSEPPYGVGSKFEQGLKGPGGRIAGDYEITELVPNERIGFRVSAGPARPTGLYRFQPEDEATRLTFVLGYKAAGLSKLMEPMIQKSMEQEVGMLEELKAFLEKRV
jgi:uncharacterized membrane protein